MQVAQAASSATSRHFVIVCLSSDRCSRTFLAFLQKLQHLADDTTLLHAHINSVELSAELQALVVLDLMAETRVPRDVVSFSAGLGVA